MEKQSLHQHCMSLRTSFAKLKLRIPSLHHHTSLRHSKPTGGATRRLLSACKCPKTPSFGADRDLDSERDGTGSKAAQVDLTGATLSDIERFLNENFRSLYATHNIDSEHVWSSSQSSCRHETDWPAADLIRPSKRFFVYPGTSSSVIEDTRESRRASSSTSSLSVSSGKEREKLLAKGVPVVTLSRDPCDDIRRSMQGMVEAQHTVAESCRQLDWDFMEELLFCYLELNDRSVRKYILKAFTDLILAFRGSNDSVPTGRRVSPSHGNEMSRKGSME